MDARSNDLHHNEHDDMPMKLPASGVMPKKAIKKIVPTLLERIVDSQPDNRSSKPPSPYDNYCQQPL